MKTIKDLQSEDYILLQNDGDILELQSETGLEYDGFIVKIENAEYAEIYGFYGVIPWLDKQVVRVK